MLYNNTDAVGWLLVTCVLASSRNPAVRLRLQLELPPLQVRSVQQSHFLQQLLVSDFISD
jgi:hypothetical protein